MEDLFGTLTSGLNKGHDIRTIQRRKCNPSTQPYLEPNIHIAVIM